MRPQLLHSLALATQVSAAPFLTTHPDTSAAEIHPLHIFPNGTAAENLLIRPDGSVLMTMLTPSATLYYFPNCTTTSTSTSNCTPTLLATFPPAAAAYGITPYAPNTYAVLTGTFSRSGLITNATGSVWSVNMTHHPHKPAQVSRLLEMENVGFLNGLATLNAHTLLAADSVLGVVYAIDTDTASYGVVLNDTALRADDTGPVRLGVNGLALVDDTLFFTNTNKRCVGRVRLAADGSAAGPYTEVASGVLVDDLDVDAATGEVYIASLTGNAISYVAADGAVGVLAGSLNSSDVPGPTAVKLVRDEPDKRARRLLVSTSGGIEYPINGTYIQGGGLYEIDIDIGSSL